MAVAVAVAVAVMGVVGSLVATGVGSLCRVRFTTRPIRPTITIVAMTLAITATIFFDRRRPGLERVVQPGSVPGFAAERGPVEPGSEWSVGALPSSGLL